MEEEEQDEERRKAKVKGSSIADGPGPSFGNEVLSPTAGDVKANA
jgi:hypothetical protein